MDLIQRITGLLDSLGVPALILAAAAMAGLVAIVWLRKVRWLLWSYFFLLMFSGFFLSTVENSATALRWLLIPLLPLAATSAMRKTGLSSTALFGASILLLALLPLSEEPAFGFQSALLLAIFTGPFAAGIAGNLQTRQDVHNLLRGFLAISTVFVVMAIYSVVAQGSNIGRLTEVNKSTPLLVITAGLMMQLLAWGYITHPNWKVRSYCVGAFIVITGVCVLTSQRTGFFAGLLGLLPFVFRDAKSSVIVPIALCVIGFGGYMFLSFAFPDQLAFVEYRYTEKGLTGRNERWEAGIQRIMESPFVGHGPGAGRSADFGGFHNAFLAVWYEGGLAVFALWVFAIALGLYRASRLIFKQEPMISNLGRLSLAWLIVNILAGSFESKLYSPSNIQIFTLVLSFALIEVGMRLSREGSTFSKRSKKWRVS